MRTLQRACKFPAMLQIIAENNDGYKMIGVGHLVAEEMLGEKQALLESFQFNRYAKGELNSVSSSPYPWSKKLNALFCPISS
ncbi:MAG: hypothetical protein V3V04_02275 [Rhizobiaceae bacterium]